MAGSIIGLTGYAQHGKDSTGKILVDDYGYTRYAFADILKSMALTLDPIIFIKHREQYQDNIQSGREDIARWDENIRLAAIVKQDGWDSAKSIPEVRRFLQVLGTEAVREHLGNNAWVGALELKLIHDGKLVQFGKKFVAADDTKVVITDVRFPNEATWLQTVGGSLWRVKRVVLQGKEIQTPGSYFIPFDNGLGTDHPSEKHIKDLFADKELVAANLSDLRQEVVASVVEEVWR